MGRLRSKVLWLIAVLLAVNAILLAAMPAGAFPQSLAAVPRNLTQYFFGPKLVRMDVVVNDGGQLHYFRVDQGRVRLVRPTFIRLLERDGSVVTIPVAPDAEVLVRGRRLPLTAVRRGMLAITVRDNAGDDPAEMVVVKR